MANAPNGSPKLPDNITPHQNARFPPPKPKPKPPEEKGAEPGRPETQPDEPAQQAGPLSPEKWQELVDTFHLHRRRLLRIPDVTAVDIGYKLKEKEHTFTSEVALRVHVERKLPRSCFKHRRHDFINPKDYPVPIDIIEADYKPVQLAEPPRPRVVLERPRSLTDAGRRQRLDPLVGGISIGSPQVPAGTLGALVWDRIDGSVCILSNWHVLSGDLHAEVGTPCFQPGRFDQGRSSDVVAHLKRWSFDGRTDAAIAQLTGNRRYCAGEIVSMYQQISGVTDPHLGMMVLKSGRSTGFTWGFVDGLYFTSVIEYSHGVAQLFEDQIHIAPVDPNVRISEGGDSGSVWVTESNGEGYRAVGLHFAGDLPHSAFGEYALANPMRIVEERLSFSFRPRFLKIPDEQIISRSVARIEQSGNGNGVHPTGTISGGTLTGSSGQPDPIPIGET